jgi:hypothetical protein
MPPAQPPGDRKHAASATARAIASCQRDSRGQRIRQRDNPGVIASCKRNGRVIACRQGNCKA